MKNPDNLESGIEIAWKELGQAIKSKGNIKKLFKNYCLIVMDKFYKGKLTKSQAAYDICNCFRFDELFLLSDTEIILDIASKLELPYKISFDSEEEYDKCWDEFVSLIKDLTI